MDSTNTNRRLTATGCRARLGQSAHGLSDTQLLEIRDRLYGLASSLLAVHRSAFDRAVAFAQLPDDDRIEVAERAAILEFDGGLTRDQAERLALSMYNSRVSRAN